MLEKILKSPLDSKEIKPVNPNGNQLWIFIGRTDVEAAILWPPDAKNWLIWKDPDTGKNWRQKEKGAKEDEVDSIINSMDMNLSTKDPGMTLSMGSESFWHNLATEQ